VPFGEYLPWRSWLGPILEFLQIPMSNFSAGTAEEPILTLAGQQAGVNICYEDVFANEVVRALPAAGYLINASNDAWFGDSLAPHQHLQIARMRAKETERYLLRSTNTGISAIIDEKGQIQQQAPQFEMAIVTEKIQARQGATPYVTWGNWGLFILILINIVGMKIIHRQSAS
jgi:apolipoprotein N-acyltransferase